MSQAGDFSVSAREKRGEVRNSQHGFVKNLWYLLFNSETFREEAGKQMGFQIGIQEFVGE